MKHSTLAVGALLLALGRVAAAEPAQVEPDDRSPNTALAWSLGGTGASAALFLAGISANSSTMIVAGLVSSVVTPSLGEWYSGQYLTVGLGVRAASAVAVIYGFGHALCGELGSCSANERERGDSIMIAGLVGYAAGAVYDIAMARSIADDYNRDHHRVRVTPAILNPPSGAVMGVGLGGTF